MCKVVNARQVGKRSMPDRVYVGRPSKWPTFRDRARRGGRKYRAWMVQQPAPKAAPHETNREPILDSTPSRPDPLYWSGEFAPAWNDRHCDAGILRQQGDHLQARHGNDGNH